MHRLTGGYKRIHEVYCTTPKIISQEQIKEEVPVAPVCRFLLFQQFLPVHGKVRHRVLLVQPQKPAVCITYFRKEV